MMRIEWRAKETLVATGAACGDVAMRDHESECQYERV